MEGQRNLLKLAQNQILEGQNGLDALHDKLKYKAGSEELENMQIAVNEAI